MFLNKLKHNKEYRENAILLLLIFITLLLLIYYIHHIFHNKIVAVRKKLSDKSINKINKKLITTSNQFFSDHAV